MTGSRAEQAGADDAVLAHDGAMKPLTLMEASAALRAAVLRLLADLTRSVGGVRAAARFDTLGRQAHRDRLGLRLLSGWWDDAWRGPFHVCDEYLVRSPSATECYRCGHAKNAHYR